MATGGKLGTEGHWEQRDTGNRGNARNRGTLATGERLGTEGHWEQGKG